MPSVLVTDSLNCELGGAEPWPDDVRLFQPYETEQILLPDFANCLAVQAFLRMCNLKYTVEYRKNAEYMSPSGKVPFIKCGTFIVSDLEPITNFVANKGISLTSNLDPSMKADLRAYISLVNTVLGPAENYLMWCDDKTYNLITKPRYGSIHPFPLNHLIPFLKRHNVTKKLKALKWMKESNGQVLEEVNTCFNALSTRLGDNKYFFGDQPCELDAAVFGHLLAILSSSSLKSKLVCELADLLMKHKSLINFTNRLLEDLKVFNEHKPVQDNLSENNKSIDSSEGSANEFVFEDDSVDPSFVCHLDYSVLTNQENEIYGLLVE